MLLSMIDYTASDLVDSRIELINDRVVYCKDSCANVSSLCDTDGSLWLNDADCNDCSDLVVLSLDWSGLNGVSSLGSSCTGLSKCLSTSCCSINRSFSCSSCLDLICRLNWVTLDLSSSSRTTVSLREYWLDV